MGFRFRKSFKVAPGVRLNLGKKSASVSFGGKGARHTISTTGRRTSSVGIPGSGLYYTKSSSAKKARNNTNFPGDQDYINPIEEVEEFNAAIKYITSFHKKCDYNYDWKAISKKSPPFKYKEKGPNEIKALKNLHNYEPNLLGKVFKFVAKNKERQLEEKVESARKKDEKLYKEWKKRNKIARLILQEDLETYMKLLKDIKFCNKLAGFVPSIKCRTSNKDMMIIEYDLNIDDIVPAHYKTLTKTGRLSIRKYNKTDYYAIIKKYVSSFALRIARNIFGMLPIKTAIINTQTNVLDTQIGKINNITILSVKIDKATLSELNFNLIDPFDALNNFEHNVKFLKTKGFKPVEKLKIN